ncbi:membrane protein FxsA [Pseudaminobacter sp. 19-2017]|uniref:Membrane protein FxsA n=1 Tax=Pseudaminobacter soli (ex Zhang et al. 2022) TaxID=2831468 RepID=A0A942I9U7_9HYPH|nr:membrane protein FxsA [Pseudaminobacter soli]
MARLLLPLFFIGLPLIEIAGFAFVGSAIGVLPTIGLVILSTILGSVLLRLQGFGALGRIQQEIAAGRNPGRELAHGTMILVAGILLIIPGFFTDIIGLLLFLPPVRDFAWTILRSRIGFAEFKVFRQGYEARGPGRGGPTIDLDAEDYSRARDPESPWRRLDDRG